MLRWIVGCLIILALQVVVYGLALKLLSVIGPVDVVVALGILAVCVGILTFIFSEVLERDYWLSRFLRLPINPNRRPIARSIIWAIAGPLALFVYTQHVARPQMQASASRGEIAPQPTDNMREIVETIVFVVVLVLLLKSFTAEAFVIPTGSMAETLWGYQKVVTCPTCKYQFPVNASSEADAQDRPPIAVLGCQCENCRQLIQFPQARPDPNAVTIPDPGWTSGDRVLVAKFLYDLFGKLPDRLNVVVFKFPGDENGPSWPKTGPQKNHTPINYIKRLIGLPGEMIAIKEGKLFILSADKVRQLGLNFDDLAGLTPEQREVVKPQLWRKMYFVPGDEKPRDALHIDNPEARKVFEAGNQYAIVRKAPEVILAVRRIVYDNDHPASDLVGPDWQRWQTSDSWTDDGKNGFQHKADKSDLQWLTYRHILRGHAGKPQLINDFMGYNSNYGGDSPAPTAPTGSAT